MSNQRNAYLSCQGPMVNSASHVLGKRWPAGLSPSRASWDELAYQGGQSTMGSIRLTSNQSCPPWSATRYGANQVGYVRTTVQQPAQHSSGETAPSA